MKRLGRMPAAVRKAGFLPGYLSLVLRRRFSDRRAAATAAGAAAAGPRDFEDRELKGYPSNHNYRVGKRSIVPSFDLHCRWKLLSALYPEPVGSLLDVGSCKGFFVLEAASRPGCERAVGIDVYEPFIELSARVRAYLGVDNAFFHTVFLEEVFQEPARYGAPFRAILLINTYHYLYWGSAYSPKHLGGHREILAGLAAICEDRVIFSSPLEIRDCPRKTQAIAAGDPEKNARYTRSGFLETARKHFDVEDHGYLGKRPLLLLRKKEAAGGGSPSA